jgi:hypothetical protein
MHKVAEHLNRDPGRQGVIDEFGQVRVHGRLSADELHHRHTQPGGLVDHPLPVGGRHRPMRACRAAVGIAMDALQLAFAGDF